MTLVCGPAGSGKTALLSSVLGRGSDQRVAWVSLEPGDDDPARFWDAVLTSLALAGAAPAGSALAALAPPVRDSRRAFMPLLVNALAELPEPVILVLDDVHIAALARMPGRSRLPRPARPGHAAARARRARRPGAAAARPARARAAGRDPRGGPRVHRAARRRRCSPRTASTSPPELVAALCARTEGWGAGLRLAALSLQGRDDPERFVEEFAGDDRVVGDYLLAEVLDRQPPRLRSFLLRTSIVDRVCGDLADALTTQGSSSDILAELERTNGFVLGVDSRREWYRYHRLFAKLLRTRAARELGDELPRLHARAARWYAARGMGSQALHHAVAAADWDLAVELVAEHWFDLFVRGQGDAIRSARRRAAGRAPARRRRAGRGARVRGVRGRRRARPAQLHLEHARAAEAGLPAERRRRYLETMALARLYRARLDGDFEAALEAADELLAEAAAARRLVRRRPPGARARVHSGARRCGRTSSTAPARSSSRPSSQARAAGLDYVAVSAQSALGLLARHAARPGRASRAPARRSSSPSGAAGATILETACAHAALALAAFYDLRPLRPRSTSHGARDALSHGRTRHVEFMLDHLEARMAGAAGPPRGGPAGARTPTRSRTGAARTSPYERAALASMRARLLAASGDLEAAGAMLAPARADGLAGRRGHRRAPAAGRRRPGRRRSTRSNGRRTPSACTPSPHLEHIVLEAIARDTAGEPGRAGEAIERALEQAEATGHRWTFIEGGRRVEALLRAPHPQRHGAPRDRRRAAGGLRGARPRAPDRRAAAGAALRARVRDPALPPDHALQPRDRGRAVRHHQHGQDAPAQHLPQARRRPPARGGRARPRPAVAVNRRPALSGVQRERRQA